MKIPTAGQQWTEEGVTGILIDSKHIELTREDVQKLRLTRASVLGVKPDASWGEPEYFSGFKIVIKA